MKVQQKGRGITSSKPNTGYRYTLNTKTHINTSSRPNQTRKGLYWTEPENRGLLENIKTGKSINNIAKKCKRSKGAITARLLKLRPSYTQNHIPNRKWQRWTSNEDKTLVESIKEMGINNVAKTHHRTRAAITSRLKKTPPKMTLKTMNSLNKSNAIYKGLKVSTVYDSNWKIPKKQQHELIDISIATNKLRFQSLDKYDFTKPIDVKFIFGNDMVLLQDVDIKNVIDTLNNPDITSILFLQPNL